MGDDRGHHHRHADDDEDDEGLSRRDLIRGAGALGAAAAAASVFGPVPPAVAAERIAAGRSALEPGAAAPRGAPTDRRLQWLAGDHHIHTQYSPDAQYLVVQQVGNGHRNNLDWLVITDHGGVDHQRLGVDLTYPDVVAARAAYPDLLVFQGLEWNIPSAEHGTVFVAPSEFEKDILKAFEGSYDGTVTGTNDQSEANEAVAVAGIQWLGQQVAAGRVPAALFLANHPARRGYDSPHEIRKWRDADPTVAVGMEGAPGHQAAGIPTPRGPGSNRGFYAAAPAANSFPGYPLESYRTNGGFDWMTAVVGGLWDSLLAEGKGWWITANSDSHKNWADTWSNPPPPASYANGQWPDPVDTGVPILSYGDFFPGVYSRTYVGIQDRSYLAVMDGLRAGRAWVVHGDLIRALDVTLTQGSSGATLGGRLDSGRRSSVGLRVVIDLNAGINANGDAPRLRRLDLIVGAVTGPVADPDTFVTPDTRVVHSWDITQTSGQVVIEHDLGRVESPMYVRLRGHDGNLTGPATPQDPTPPRPDPPGAADPWDDLWFYTNPVFVMPRR